MIKSQAHPGAININGVPYIYNTRGFLAPLADVKPADLLIDEQVRKMCAYAEDLSAELARFQSHTYADIASLDAMLDQEYGVVRTDGRKGNRTFTSYDGKLQVKVCVADQIAFGPELQSAKALLDELILEKAEGADPFLVALVTQAFSPQKEGKVDVAAILALRRLQVDDPRWVNVTRAIDDSVRVQGSKSYLRFYRRSEGDQRMQMIPLDLAAVEPTAAAFERQSLRRQVEELGSKLEAAGEQLSLARSYAEDGALATMLSCLDQARELLGEKESPTDLTVPGLDGATAPAYVLLWLQSLPEGLLADAVGNEAAAAVAKAIFPTSQAAE